jgi:hypothetical protein
MRNLLLIITSLSLSGCGTIGIVQTKIEYTDGERTLKITQPKNTSLSGLKFKGGEMSVDKYSSRADGNALQATEAIESMRAIQGRGALSDLEQQALLGFRSYLGQTGAISQPPSAPVSGAIPESVIDAAISRYMKNQGKTESNEKSGTEKTPVTK